MSAPNDFISIIIPVYNIENYITRCLQSLQKQTIQHFEIIVIDDGSTDGSKNNIVQLATKDHRIKYYYQENKGVSSARNKGLALAEGTYIIFIDGDDFVHENFLYEICKEIHSCNVLAIITNILPKSNATEKERLKAEEAFNRILEGSFDRTACGILFRKAVIEEFNLTFDEDIQYGEDMVFTLKYLNCHKIDEVVFLNKNMYVVEERQNSSMRVADPYFYKKTLHLKNILECYFMNKNSSIETISLFNRYFMGDYLLANSKLLTLEISKNKKKTVLKEQRFEYVIDVSTVPLTIEKIKYNIIRKVNIGIVLFLFKIKNTV
ncbi:glycosyltransferase family 2 protein [Lysinibacillus agricola]|uniref:Glycosyltransferase family 2 protein n=1 Tax=Lysinibacillus agricola TaxID=2590012 RepID=A0ABX7AV71_9BACI|nr:MULTISPECIES: glycosyltransferase family 2 protein [Lysinibacillus]QQP13701.1 glycosyltransferase family 2 protein [Lysinibacillus agricola]